MVLCFGRGDCNDVSPVPWLNMAQYFITLGEEKGFLNMIQYMPHCIALKGQ
jgi:hypothetical protein